jgi:beta-galactosidase
VLIGSLATWKRLQPTAQGASLRTAFEAALNRGRTALLLDIGPRDLGQGYKNGDLGPLDGAPRISEPKRETDALFAGVRLSFLEAPEPESHFHPGPEDSSLWHNLPRESTWMWNGLRGGLVVPAADMAVAGLSARAFLALWSSRGADASALQSAAGEYYAYELAGFYAFSRSPKDKAIIAALRQKVKLLADDAPALQDRINPNAPIEALNLVEAYRASGAQGQAERLISLASCGKNLTRIPVVELSFGTGKGHLIVSQLLTAGRLRRGAAEPGLYGLRYDPAAEQFVLNLLARSLADASQP